MKTSFLGLLALSAWLAGAHMAAAAPAVKALIPAVKALIPVVKALVPANGARNVCIDMPLRITFDRVPQAAMAGRVHVFRADGDPVDTINIGAPSTRLIGGAVGNDKTPYLFNYEPVVVTGSTVTFFLHQALAYGQTYYVTVDPGAITDTHGTAFSDLTAPNVWRFTTKAAPPPAGTTAVTVAADGTGDFATVQGAIDFVPSPNTHPFTINVRRGVYTEIVHVGADKPFLTVRGQDRDKTILQYANNANLNKSKNRVLFGVDADDFTLEDITLHNTTPYHGSQAETLRVNGRRARLIHDTFLSFQDTLLLSGTVFVSDCFVEGDVDFMWGTGADYFQDCELRAMHPGYYTQIRNPQGANGNVYVHCRLTRDPGLAEDTVYLGRIDPAVYPYSQVVLIDCAMDTHIRPVGWLLDNDPTGTAPDVQFWEYHSTDLRGRPLDVSRRAAFSRPLSDAEAAHWRDPATVLGGWVPTLPPTHSARQ